jgi:hypothetical protein
MHYITKSETPVHLPQNIKWPECTVQPSKVTVNIYLYFYQFIYVCFKTNKVYIYGDENI